MAADDTVSARSPKSDGDPKPILNEVGEQILTALESIFQSAQRALAEGPSGISRDSLVYTTAGKRLTPDVIFGIGETHEACFDNRLQHRSHDPGSCSYRK